MRMDCGDIRLYDSNPEGNSFRANSRARLNYWIEHGCNSKDTLIWVRVPSIPKGSKTIFVTYGNPTLRSASNGERTFEFFDDFNGTTLDKKKWELYGDSSGGGGGKPEVNVSNGILAIKGDAINDGEGIKTALPLPPPFAYKVLMRRASGNYDIYAAVGFPSKPGYGAMLGIGNYGKEWRHVSWTSSSSDYTFGTADNNWHTFENIICRRDNIANISGVMSNHNIPGEKMEDISASFRIHTWSQNGATTLEADWVFIRKNAFVEPTAQVGGEEVVLERRGDITF